MDALEAVVGTPFTYGNAIDVYRNGVEIFPAMLGAIEEARSFIDFETFVYWKGDIAVRFAGELADAASRGVDVRVLLDAVGCLAMPEELVEHMEEAGVEVRRFRPVRFGTLGHLTRRTHRKILVCDGRVAFTGGVGIAEEWEGDARDPTEWRETHFRVRGPAVAGIWSGFAGNWTEACPDYVPFRARSAGGLTESLHESPGTSAIQVIRASTTSAWSDVATILRALLPLAQRRLRITTAYFVPDRTTTGLLRAAAESGVDVDIIVPGPHIDHRLAQLAGAAVFDEMLGAGVRIWTYQTTMIHAKVLTVDGLVSLIGSANFNHRSMRKDDELSLLVADSRVAGILDDHFMEDRERCEPLDPASWGRRPLLRRALERAARVFRSEL